METESYVPADAVAPEQPEDKDRRHRRSDHGSDTSRRRRRDKERRRSRSRDRTHRRVPSSRKRSKSPRKRKTQFDVRPEANDGDAGAIVPAGANSVIPQDVLLPPDPNDPDGNPPLLYPGMGLPGKDGKLMGSCIDLQG